MYPLINHGDFIRTCGGVSAATSFPCFHVLAAPQKSRVKIRDIKVMVLQGPRTYTLVKVVADSGIRISLAILALT
jgi:hypothetical protein